MNIDRFDFMLIFGMMFAIIAMSFVFPELGLASLDAKQSEIPDLDVNSSSFDLAGEFPEQPGTPTSGTLGWNDSVSDAFNDNETFLSGDTDDGVQIKLFPGGGSTDPSIGYIHHVASNVTVAQFQTFTSLGQRFAIENESDGYVIAFTVTEYNGTSEDYAVEWELNQQPSSGGSWIDRIPVVGGVFSTAEAIASMLAWGVSVVLWFFEAAITVVLNVVGILLDIMAFGLEFILWLSTTYGNIVSGAPAGWVALFAAMPGVILTFELMKIAVIGIRSIPFA